MKNTQYNSYLWPNHQNFRILKEIVVEEHDHNVRFYTGSGNTAVLRMRKCNYSFFAHAQWKIRNITFIYGRIAKNFRVLKEIGVEECNADLRF